MMKTSGRMMHQLHTPLDGTWPTQVRRSLAGMTGLSLIIVAFQLLDLSFLDMDVGYYYPDELYYNKWGNVILKSLEENGFLSTLYDAPNIVGSKNFLYQYWVGVHYYLLGNSPYFPIVSNVLLVLITGWLLSVVTDKLMGQKEAFVVYGCYILNPFVMYWAVHNLKDTLIAFLLVVVFFSILALQKRARLLWIVLLLVSISALSALRFYLAMILIPILSLYLAKSLKNGIIIVIVLLGMFFMVLPSSLASYIQSQVQAGIFESVVENLTRSRDIASQTGYSIAKMIEFDVKSFVYLLSHFLFSPSPINLSGDGKALIIPNLYWYVMLLLASNGMAQFFSSKNWLYNKNPCLSRRDIIASRRYLRLVTIFILTIVMVNSSMPVLNEPRHRLMIVPFVTLFVPMFKINSVGMISMVSILLWEIISIVGREVLVV